MATKTDGAAQTALVAAQLTLSADDTALLARLCELVMTSDLQTARAAAHLMRAVLAAARLNADDAR
jgi:hypothetical protein